MGLVSVNLVPRNEDNLARGWCERVADGFHKLLDDSFQTYRLVGRFSNGEAIYERVGQRD